MSRREDDEQFRLFVQRQWGPLLRTAYLLTGDRGTAEDLVQSALEKTHRRWGRVLRRDAPEVYVRRAMVNTAISWRRRRRPLEVPLLTSDSAPTGDAYAQVEERQWLLTALRRLPPRTQAVLVLRYFEDLSEVDTAKVLGCSVGSVKSQASRGLARLRGEFALPDFQTPVRLEEELA
ncbi:SigE family RNA polymerase sigma factor [Micromonospora chokoriensis]|uniref:SigE family RNA polymerase sigma factor n=1 Tax=Micromonospora chokoriensis TaxID=356851 RepID=UPI0004C343ED|nr:SigE family RNA polymerase sigma factor [Micromonospora chokoriensis]